MNEKSDQNKKEGDFLRTAIISVICIPIIIWLVYSAYQKNQQSGIETAACEKKCSQEGYSGYAFQWPIFTGPQCACLGSRL